jgi:phytoene dehydrogenase-like protein
MNETFDVLVVGGGAAGLTAAAYCAKAGFSTLVCERWEKTGGLVDTFRYRDFAFDAGIRALEDSGVITPLLRSLELPIEFVKNPVTIGIKDRSVRLTGEESLAEYAALYKSFFPQESAAIDAIIAEVVKVMRYMDVLYGIENPLFLEEELKDPRYLTRTLLPWLLKYSVNIKKAGKLDQPVQQYLLKFTQNQELIDMICQHFFADTPTFFALSYFGLYLDYRYPVGGTVQLPRQLASYLTEHGGEIRTKHEAVKIDATAHTVTFENGAVIGYRQLIWAADQTAYYRALGEDLPKDIAAKKELAQKSHGIDSILTLFIGSGFTPDEAQKDVGAHAFYTPLTCGLSSLSDWREVAKDGIEALKRWVVEYLEKTTFEISVPALRDASLAPEGKTGLIVSTLFDYDLTKHFSDAGEYQALKDLAQETILRVLGDSILPQLPERVEFALCSTPMTIERETGSRHGAITGWAHYNHPMPAVHEFGSIAKATETGVADILQCGMWTFSPAGLPVSIITGKLAADQAIKNLKKKK